MKLYRHILLNVSLLIPISLANMKMDPRWTHPMIGKGSFSLPKEEANAVFHLSENHTMYIGGEEILYHSNFETMKTYPMEADSEYCQEKCKNHVTFVGQVLGKLTVCGTNADDPGCWAMDGETFQKLKNPWTVQMAPRTPVANYNILISGNQVYSTLARITNNGGSMKKVLFRKILGDKPLLYTGDTFLRHPEFVKSLVVEKENKVQNKILLFFTEDNEETRTTEKRLAMVAQLCKEESGSVKANTRNVFSTALKSRMICGNQLTGQYYPHLQDIYFVQRKSKSVIYGLFKNSWNHSAVCSYEVEHIENLFKTSSLLGSSQNDLRPRPGTCLPAPTLTPAETSEEASSYPELTDWLWPSANRTVFQNLENYRKIVVDVISTGNRETYSVIILATDNGTVHKVVELEDGALNILKVTPFKKNGRLRFMELDPKEHMLYMGTTLEISRLPLDDCSAYNTKCMECIEARDPFCGWIDGRCDSVLKHNSTMVLQSLKQNATCNQGETSLTMFVKGNQPLSMETQAYKTQYFLTCPTMSKHASYTWKNGDTEMGKCNSSRDICELMIDEVTHPGEYKCMVRELDTERAVLSYKFKELNIATQIQCIWLLVLPIQLLLLM